MDLSVKAKATMLGALFLIVNTFFLITVAILLFIFNFLIFFHLQKDFMFFESKQEDDS
jgi:hypothetical protein